MKIKFHCRCGKRIKVLLHRIGKRIKCPLCNHYMYVPDIDFPNVIRLDCDCGVSLPRGTNPCPACGREISKEVAYATMDLDEEESPSAPIPTIYNPISNPSNNYQKVYLVWAICLAIILGSHIYIYFATNSYKELPKLFKAIFVTEN